MLHFTSLIVLPIWVSASSLQTNYFIGNSANGTSIGGGDAINTERDSSFSFSGVSNFSHRCGSYRLYIYISFEFTFNSVNFKNSANNYGCGGAIYATNSRTNNFISNTADNTSGSVIVAGNSTCIEFH